jgi:hypothetical protein
MAKTKKSGNKGSKGTKGKGSFVKRFTDAVESGKKDNIILLGKIECSKFGTDKIGTLKKCEKCKELLFTQCQEISGVELEVEEVPENGVSVGETVDTIKNIKSGETVENDGKGKKGKGGKKNKKTVKEGKSGKGKKGKKDKVEKVEKVEKTEKPKKEKKAGGAKKGTQPYKEVLQEMIKGMSIPDIAEIVADKVNGDAKGFVRKVSCVYGTITGKSTKKGVIYQGVQELKKTGKISKGASSGTIKRIYEVYQELTKK